MGEAPSYIRESCLGYVLPVFLSICHFAFDLACDDLFVFVLIFLLLEIMEIHVN